VVPLVQVLMQSRKRVAYVAVLEALREALPQFRPELVITDFECAQMQAWVQVYNVPVQGCYWHFSRAVSILSRTMGLTHYLRLHPRAKSIVRSLLALPLLPQNLIMEGFMSLAYEAAEEAVYAVLHTFFLRVLQTWLVGFRFEMMSVFLADHRTNNVSESANRMLRLRTQVHHPNISLFLEAVRAMETNSYLDLLALEEHRNPGRPRRASAVNNDIFILNYTQALVEGQIDVRRFLHLSSRRMLNIFREYQPL
ncbi:Glutamate receptor ionotropic, NMDA 2C, partial [Frankliniella fusca]